MQTLHHWSVTVKLVPPKSSPPGPNIILYLVRGTKFNIISGPPRTNLNITHGPPLMYAVPPRIIIEGHRGPSEMVPT